MIIVFGFPPTLHLMLTPVLYCYTLYMFLNNIEKQSIFDTVIIILQG